MHAPAFSGLLLKKADLRIPSSILQQTESTNAGPAQFVDSRCPKDKTSPLKFERSKGECTMYWNRHQGQSAILDTTPITNGSKKLRALIDQAISDSVDESDEHAGLLSMIREEVVCPFSARIAGEPVECVRFDWPKNGYGLNAVCKSKGKTHVVDISTLEWIEPRPKGHEWIEAYFAWRDLVN
jgi:hypothetical protein